MQAPANPLGALEARLLEGAVVDVIHGRDVPDPYRALELDDPLTWEWVDAQTERTHGYFEAHAREERAERLEALLSIGFFGDVAWGGERVFYTKRDGDAEQASLYVLDATAPDAGAQLLLDPNVLGERVAIDWHYPSPQGRYVAYGLSRDGDERSTLYVLDVDSGEGLTEAIEHTKWTGLAWLHDESGFYYTRYPSPGEPDYNAEDGDNYYRHLFFHELGADPVDDPLVFRVERTDFVGPTVSPDDRWVILNNFHSWSESDLLLIDRQAGAEAVPVVVGEDFYIYGGVYEGQLIVFSNEDNPRGRILAADPQAIAVGDAAALDRAGWTELVPETEATIESFDVSGGRLLVRTIEDIAAAVRLYELGAEGATPLGEIELPTAGSVGGAALSRDGSRVAFTFHSFFYPPGLWVASQPFSEQTEPRQIDQVSADIDTGAYELERVSVTSADGTPINMFLVHRSDMPRDGRQPVLVNGYGGFASAMMPGFRRNVLYWLEQGGVFAMPNIRGGGEYGEAWHEAGMLHNKPNVFDDFEAAIRWLTDSGISSPDRIAIMGASNGGLLMGAMITRCPEAFRAAVASVGLYDMVRFTEFPPAEIWMGEYGNPEEPDDFQVLLDYSPYHSVEPGTPYPAVLVETAEQDTRVSWRHSTKFAAALQGATSSPHEILFYMSRDTGHGAGTGRSDIVEQYVRYYTFIETELGLAE